MGRKNRKMRHRFQVAYEILCYCKIPRKVTHVIEKVNVNSGVGGLFRFLVAEDLITHVCFGSRHSGKNMFQTSKKGLCFINVYDQLGKLLPPESLSKFTATHVGQSKLVVSWGVSTYV